MILLQRDKVRKLQGGGSFYRNPGIGEQFTPIDITTKGFAGLYQGNSGSRGSSPGSRGSARNVGKQAKEDRMNSKGFANDIDHAFTWRDGIANRIASRSMDTAYAGSAEYQNDHRELQEANRAIAQLESIKKNFDSSLNKKKIDQNARAIRNNRALVYDATDSDYKIVNLREALSSKYGDKSRYNIETIATAQNLRSIGKDFHFFTEDGKEVQDMVLNSYNKAELYKQIDQAYKNAGISKGKDAFVNLSDGTQVDVDEWYRYITDELTATGTTERGKYDNASQLQAAIQNLTGRILSDSGTHSAMQDMAVGSIINDGLDVSSMTDSEFNDTIQQYMNRDLLTRMQSFLESGYDDKIKLTSKKSKSSSGKDPSETTNIHTNNALASLTHPTRNETFEVKSLIEDEPGTAATGFATAEIASSYQFIAEGFVGAGETEDGKPVYRLDKNANIAAFAEGTLEESTSLFDGTMLKDLNEGNGVQSAVVLPDQKLKVHYQVPVIKDNVTGEETINSDYIAFLDLYQTTVNKLLEGKEADAQATKEIAEDVWSRWVDKDPKFAEFADSVMNGTIIFKNVMSFDVLVPEKMRRWGMETGDYEEYGKNLQQVSAKKYAEHSDEEYFADHWIGFGFDDDVFKAKVFVTMKPLSELQFAQLEGIDKLVLKDAEMRKIVQTQQQERKAESKPMNSWDLLAL